MALLSLAVPTAPGRLRMTVLMVGLAGASLFFGDAMITPAISVLSAVEGLGVATPVFTPYVVPIAAAVLVGLFVIQSHGSARMGRLFGPVMAVWFAETPDVPAALRLHREAVGFAPEEASYFLGNEVPVPSLQPELPRWQE